MRLTKSQSLKMWRAELFKSLVWPSFWTTPIKSSNTFTSFQSGATSWVNGSIAADSSPGFHATYFQADASFQILTSNSDPSVNIITPGSWANRSSGSTVVGSTHCPTSIIIPDGTQTNNPTIILNQTTAGYAAMNGSCIPTAGSNVYGYYSNSVPYTHGGSSILGGEVTQGDLLKGAINHALAIEVWGAKYFDRATPYRSPATSEDAAYNVSSSPNYYNGQNGTNIVGHVCMGTRVAIPATTSLTSLVSSPTVLTQQIYQALVEFGAYIVDNSAGDYLNVCCTYDISDLLNNDSAQILALFTGVQAVT